MDNLPLIQIALVDDSLLITNSFPEYLHNIDHRFNIYLTAKEGQDLLNQISRSGHQPDICLIDIRMKGMNGYDTMLELRKKWPRIHGIALTEIDEEYAILKMLDNGAGAYLSKNDKPETIRKTILGVYEYGYYISDTVRERFPKLNKQNLHEYTRGMLTDRETEYLCWSCYGLTDEEIGEKMNVGKKSAELYCAHIKEKLGLSSKIALVQFALVTGIGHFVPRHKQNGGGIK